MMDTASFGRDMRLDNCFITSERDEFFYHECMAHPAAMAHPEPRSALIIGGALVLHLGSPIFHAEQVRRLSQTLHGLFQHVRCYGVYVPLSGAYWGMAVCSDRLDAKAVTEAVVQ